MNDKRQKGKSKAGDPDQQRAARAQKHLRTSRLEQVREQELVDDHDMHHRSTVRGGWSFPLGNFAGF
jgi:hypothetical protein